MADVQNLHRNLPESERRKRVGGASSLGDANRLRGSTQHNGQCLLLREGTTLDYYRFSLLANFIVPTLFFCLSHHV